jgi:hypothetical protein
MLTRVTAVLMTLAMVVTSVAAQSLPGSGMATKSVPFSGAVYNAATQEFVDINGSLNVVRTIKYGQYGNEVVLLSELTPGIVAFGRDTGRQ